MSNKTGRNDPCPCGSGKKFKRCCGGPGASAARAASPQTVPHGAVKNAVKYVSGPDWEPEKQRALHVYLEPLPEVDVEGLDAIFADEPALGDIFDLHFHEWLLSDYESTNGRNPIEDYLARRGWQETPPGREWLQGLRDHRMSLYEIRALTPGEGMTMHDALRGGDPIEVHEQSATQTLGQWDYIATRVVPFHGRNLLSGSGLHIPRDVTAELIEELRVARREYPDWEAYLRVAAPEFMAEYLDRFIHRPPPPELRTSDGDPMCFAKLRFSYPAELRPQVLATLEAHPAFEATGDVAFHWLEREEGAKDDNARILGHVELGAREGHLETQSEARLERGSELLRTILPAEVEYSYPVYEDVWQAVENRPAGDKPAPPDIPADQMQAIVQQVLDRQYEHWCDEPIPALNGKTPRQAVATGAGRRDVIELLKSYENSNARLPVDQQYDYGWMWEALKLDRDEAMDAGLDPDESEEAIAGRRALVMDAIAEQMEANDPPETRQTYERLLKAGHTHDDAMNLIGCALASEVWEVMNDEREYDNDAYVRRLHNLPRLPWDDEE